MSDENRDEEQDEDRVCVIVARQLGAARVTPDMRLVQDLRAESLDFVQIAGAIERALGVVVSDDALFEVETVADLTAAVAEARARGGR
jgi:acyl carrier protein